MKANIKNMNKITFSILSADKILIPDYMEHYSKGQVEKLVKHFDASKLAPLVVSYRDDKYFVVDGQSRLVALRAMYGEKVRLPVQVIAGLTLEQEMQNYHTHWD